MANARAPSARSLQVAHRYGYSQSDEGGIQRSARGIILPRGASVLATGPADRAAWPCIPARVEWASHLKANSGYCGTHSGWARLKDVTQPARTGSFGPAS